MKGRTFLSAIIAGLLTFLSGWFLHGIMRPSNQTKDLDSISQFDTMRSNNFAHTISGHFLLSESNCAGFNFIHNDIVLWTNEIACNDPDTLKIRWLSDSIFMTKGTVRLDKSSPPRIDIYKVVSLDRKHLTLKSIWTGWNDAKDESLELLKQPK